MSGPSASDSSQDFAPRAKFEQTLWTQVFAAGKQDLPESQEAMAALYNAYSLPVYSFLRRSGNNRQKAKELANDFFGYLWQHNLVSRADPTRGRFRNYMIGVLKIFVLNQHKADKPDPRYVFVSIDAETAEGIYANELATNETPETLYDRHWAFTVLKQARERLRAELAGSFTREQITLLESFLVGDQEERFASLGKKLGKTEGAARTFVSRVRDQHRRLILEVIAETLLNKEDAEVEFAHLVAALNSPGLRPG